MTLPYSRTECTASNLASTILRLGYVVKERHSLTFLSSDFYSCSKPQSSIDALWAFNHILNDLIVNP